MSCFRYGDVWWLARMAEAGVGKAQRLAVGLLTLLLVDVIWVGSAELTEYIFKHQKFNKPFFSTYMKCSLFMLYLPGFLVYKPWREACRAGLVARRQGRENGYSRVTGDSEGEDQEEVADTEEEGEQEVLRRSLSEPTFLPLHGDKTSGTDSEQEQERRRVRFSRVAEVREMSASDALQVSHPLGLCLTTCY